MKSLKRAATLLATLALLAACQTGEQGQGRGVPASSSTTTTTTPSQPADAVAPQLREQGFLQQNIETLTENAAYMLSLSGTSEAQDGEAGCEFLVTSAEFKFGNHRKYNRFPIGTDVKIWAHKLGTGGQPGDTLPGEVVLPLRDLTPAWLSTYNSPAWSVCA